MIWKCIAASALAGVIALALTVLPATTQQSTPAAVNGCIFISGGVTLSNLQTTPFICDINGHLKVNTSASP